MILIPSSCRKLLGEALRAFPCAAAATAGEQAVYALQHAHKRRRKRLKKKQKREEISGGA